MDLYHYTDLSSLLSILKSNNDHPDTINLRAYSYLSMDDQVDCRYLVKQIADIKKEKDPLFDSNNWANEMIDSGFYHLGKPYFVSFTSQDNTQYMLKGFKNGNKDIALVLSESSDFHFDDPYRTTLPFKTLQCKYWDKVQIENGFYSKYDGKFQTTDMGEARELCYYACMIKDPKYAKENEVRLICFADDSIIVNDKTNGKTYVNTYNNLANLKKILVSSERKDELECIKRKIHACCPRFDINNVEVNKSIDNL